MKTKSSRFNRRQICLSILSVLAGISLFSFTILQRTNFSGTWDLNYSASKFGETPHYAAVKQWTFKQTANELDMQWIIVDAEGKESTRSEKISLDGKVNTSLGQGDITKKTSGTFSEDGKTLTINTDYSHPGKPDEVNYTISRELESTADGKQMNMKWTTPGYVLELVYDKK